MSKLNGNYHRNVFINCPFDSDYDEIFNAIVFTVFRCKFTLRCAKEFSDSHGIRIQNIVSLIEQSKYAIHDLSRVTLSETGNLPRFNMPLELGIFIGSKQFGSKVHKDKEYIIIESEQFRFKQFISDLSGQDIQSHKDDPIKAIKSIRDWLSSKTAETIPSASILVDEYKEFVKALPELCAESQWIVEELTFKEYSQLVTDWVNFSGNSAD